MLPVHHSSSISVGIHTYRQFRFISLPALYVSGLWEETQTCKLHTEMTRAKIWTQDLCAKLCYSMCFNSFKIVRCIMAATFIVPSAPYVHAVCVLVKHDNTGHFPFRGWMKILFCCILLYSIVFSCCEVTGLPTELLCFLKSCSNNDFVFVFEFSWGSGWGKTKNISKTNAFRKCYLCPIIRPC